MDTCSKTGPYAEERRRFLKSDYMIGKDSKQTTSHDRELLLEAKKKGGKERKGKLSGAGQLPGLMVPGAMLHAARSFLFVGMRALLHIVHFEIM